MSEAQEIAKGLTKVQRRELCGLSAAPQDKSITWSFKYGFPLERQGLAERTLLSDRTYLTPLGLEVRAILSQEINSHD